MIIKNPTIIIKGSAETLGGEYNIEQIVDGDNCELVVTTAGQPESKLAQVVDRSVTEITAKDLAGITSIGRYAFEGCYDLISIGIPNSVTSIDNGAFTYCSNLKSVYINDLSSWLNIDFFTSLSNPCYPGEASLYLNNKLLTNLVIPDDITEIKSYAFERVSSLETVTISNNVTRIGYDAFRFCDSLESIEIQDGVISIGSYAFSDCTSLTSITIPDSVTSIGSYVFYDCTALTEMTILATTPPELVSTNAISSATTTIYIPAGTLNAYQTATNWSDFADLFVEMEA